MEQTLDGNAAGQKTCQISDDPDRFQIFIGADDLAQFVLGRAIPAIGVRMEPFDQILLARPDGGGIGRVSVRASSKPWWQRARSVTAWLPGGRADLARNRPSGSEKLFGSAGSSRKARPARFTPMLQVGRWPTRSIALVARDRVVAHPVEIL